MIKYLPYDERTPDTQYKKGLIKIIRGRHTQPASRQGAPSTLIPEGYTMYYPMINGFPFDTLRSLRSAFHMFIGEAMWIGSGDTSLELLNKYGISYWDPWADEEHCARHGLETGQFGATYGHQYRNFNGTHLGGGHFANDGFDQLKYIVENLKANPTWRRWLITPFNPSEYELVDIIPCHAELFLVVVDGKLYLHLVQRSGDFPIGVPSNMVMWAFIGEVIARLTGLEFVHMTHFVSNAHIYGDPSMPLEERHQMDQCQGVELLLERDPKPLPTLQVNDVIIDAFRLMLDGEVDPLGRKEINPEGLPYLDFLRQNVPLEDYNPHPAIPRNLLPVSV